MSLINLLLSDDIEICEAASRVVSKIIGSKQDYINFYALIQFVHHLIKSLKFPCTEKISMLILILFNIENLNGDLNNELNEFQVFEKTENHSKVCEWFELRKLIISKIKADLNITLDSNAVENIIQMLLNYCKKIDEPFEYTSIYKFLTKLTLYHIDLI